MDRNASADRPRTRSELLTAVWSRPISEHAREWHMSDTWLRRLCRCYGVPVPPRGRWQKLRAGHQVEPPPTLEGEDRKIEFRCPKRPVTARESASEAAREATPTRAAPCSASRPSLTDVTMALLERDADRLVQYRTMIALLEELGAKLALVAELDPATWRAWLLTMRAELLRRVPRRDLEAWLMNSLSGNSAEVGAEPTPPGDDRISPAADLHRAGQR